MRTLGFTLLTALTLAACEQTACPDLIGWSVSVTVVDGDGAPIPDATLTYSADGGPDEPCDNIDDGTYLCGLEISGPMVVTASYDGETQTESFDIQSDECNVIGESVTFTFATTAM